MTYTCKQAPICNCRERSKSYQRDYGIGGIGGGATIEIDAITKYRSLRTGHQSDGTSKCRERIEVTTQQLLDQRQLQKLCLKS